MRNKDHRLNAVLRDPTLYLPPVENDVCISPVTERYGKLHNCEHRESLGRCQGDVLYRIMADKHVQYAGISHTKVSFSIFIQSFIQLFSLPADRLDEFAYTCTVMYIPRSFPSSMEDQRKCKCHAQACR